MYVYANISEPILISVKVDILNSVFIFLISKEICNSKGKIFMKVKIDNPDEDICNFDD